MYCHSVAGIGIFIMPSWKELDSPLYSTLSEIHWLYTNIYLYLPSLFVDIINFPTPRIYVMQFMSDENNSEAD